MTRAQALAIAAVDIARAVPDLPALISLLDLGEQKRLAAALREVVLAQSAEVGGRPRPDPAVWRRGRVR
jgi:hypothetical protein